MNTSWGGMKTDSLCVNFFEFLNIPKIRDKTFLKRCIYALYFFYLDIFIFCKTVFKQNKQNLHFLLACCSEQPCLPCLPIHVFQSSCPMTLKTVLKIIIVKIQDTRYIRYFIVLLCVQLYTYKTIHAKSIQKHNICMYCRVPSFRASPVSVHP